MTESDLNKMSTNELLDLIFIKINELSVLFQCHDHKSLQEVRKEVELIQKVIESKRVVEMPVK